MSLVLQMDIRMCNSNMHIYPISRFLWMRRVTWVAVAERQVRTNKRSIVIVFVSDLSRNNFSNSTFMILPIAAGAAATLTFVIFRCRFCWLMLFLYCYLLVYHGCLPVIYWYSPDYHWCLILLCCYDYVSPEGLLAFVCWHIVSFESLNFKCRHLVPVYCVEVFH